MCVFTIACLEENIWYLRQYCHLFLLLGEKKKPVKISQKMLPQNTTELLWKCFPWCKNISHRGKQLFGENIVNPRETFYCTFIEKRLLNTAKRLQTLHQKFRSGRPQLLIFYKNKTFKSTSAFCSEELLLRGPSSSSLFFFYQLKPLYEWCIRLVTCMSLLFILAST